MSALNISNDSPELEYLYPRLNSHSVSSVGESLAEETVDYLCIPDDDYPSEQFDLIPGSLQDSARLQTACQQGTPCTQTKSPDCSSEDSSAFNISWGGNDNPPVDIHPSQDDELFARKRPPPKPRGVRKLPEPEPSEDGTVDEDILKRRKNTHAARRSRMKKFLKIENLENKVDALQAENASLVLNNALLESDKRSLCAQETEYKKRIKYLEDQLKKQTQDRLDVAALPLKSTGPTDGYWNDRQL